MGMRRPNTAARRQQANLAGAGNILAWQDDGSSRMPAPKQADARRALGSGGGDAKAVVGDAKAVNDASDSKDIAEDLEGDEWKGSPFDAAPVAAVEKSQAAVEYEAKQAMELSSMGASARSEIEKDHALFLRVLIHRIQEARNIQRLWHEPARICDNDDSGKDCFTTVVDAEAAVGEGWNHDGVKQIPSAGFFVQGLRYLQTASHESVAVDILHALSGCSGSVALDYLTVGEGGDVVPSDSMAVSVQIVGGLPVWNYPNYPSVEWADYVCPVLETLLYTCYEDYITVALRTVGFTLEALEPLFDFAARNCSEADLKPNSEDIETVEPSSKPKLDGARSCAAKAVVKVCQALAPLTHAMQNAGENGGRVAKLVGPRVEKLHTLMESVRALREAYVLLENSPGDDDDDDESDK